MKKHVVLVNNVAGSVNIRQYDDADCIPFAQMWGPYENVVFESTRKADCVKFMNTNYPSIHMYVVIEQMAEGYAYIAEYDTWSGTTYQDLEGRYGSTMFESKDRQKCINYMRENCANLNCNIYDMKTRTGV